MYKDQLQCKMADSPEPEPEAKRPCNTVMTLCPLESVGNLRERYTEDTADVFFVEKETRESFPAHKEVLKVASPVFFNMFSGNWKEKDKKEIPAPEDFSWESFKAAITLLYGEEVEVKESSIPDIYRVAHLYDLREVISAFAQTIQVWDLQQLSTVVELCALAGQVEAEQKQEKTELIRAAVRYIAQHLEQVRKTSVDITGLSYQTMLMLVQCEHISAEEEDVLTTLNQWIDANPEVSIGKAQELFSHIRYGTLQYNSLLQCKVGQSNLDLTLDNHKKLLTSRLSTNLAQITPRVGQKEVLQVYPLASGLTETLQEGQHKFANISTSPAATVIYSGRQELIFELTLIVSNQNLAAASLAYGLYSVTGTGTLGGRRTSNEVKLQEHILGQPRTFKHALVQVSENGARLTLYSDTPCGAAVSKTASISFSGPFPWLLSFGVRQANSRYSLMFTHPTV